MAKITNEEAIQELYLKKKAHLIQGNMRMVELCDLCIQALELTKEFPFDSNPTYTFEEYCRRCNESHREGVYDE